jgi:hypothetical protein
LPPIELPLGERYKPFGDILRADGYRLRKTQTRSPPGLAT